MTHNSAPCFCCSGSPFSDCCKPVLADHSKALTPLMLMRSRYTAYVLADEEHLLATWDVSTRPKELYLKDNPVRWLNLTVNSSTTEEATGQVDFSAKYIDADNLCILQEKSTFSCKSGLWYYVEGINEVAREKLGRNSSCPCGSGKKFKRCCLLS